MAAQPFSRVRDGERHSTLTFKSFRSLTSDWTLGQVPRSTRCAAARQEAPPAPDGRAHHGALAAADHVQVLVRRRRDGGAGGGHTRRFPGAPRRPDANTRNGDLITRLNMRWSRPLDSRAAFILGLFRESDSLHEFLESRVCLEVVEVRLYFEEHHPLDPLIVTLLQPRHGLILVAEAG